MNISKKLYALFIGVFIVQASALAQNPVTISCESGNRNTDAANCWSFPGTTYSNATVINGSYSGRTNQLSNPSSPGGAQSPWVNFSGSGTISWSMKLDGWAGVTYRKFVLLRESASNLGVFDTLYSFNFSSSNATTVQNPSVNVNFTGVYRLYFYFYGSLGSTRGIFDDISISGDYYASPSNGCAVAVVAKDTDGDGVPDTQDAFPNDPTRAYTYTYPPTGPGTIMFEDNWPQTGDYDLNDMVLDYQYVASLSAANNVVDITYNITVRAIGANLHSGLMLQLDSVSSDAITSVKGNVNGGASWVSLGANGTEKGQTYANILGVDDVFSLFPAQGSGIINTDPKKSFLTTDALHIVVSFSNSKDYLTKISSIIMNPYLVLGQVRGNEVHLADHVPSSLADTKMFGTGADNTNPAKGVYYRTKTNLPFGIAVDAQSIPYPQEGIDFTKCYPKIANWAESNGATNADWYTSDNRTSTYLYGK